MEQTNIAVNDDVKNNKIEIDELSSNFLSDLIVDSKGWLRSESLLRDGNDDNDDDLDNGSACTIGSSMPIFSACQKLLRLLRLDGDDDGDVSISDCDEDNDGDTRLRIDGDSDVHNSDDVTDLPYVQNVLDLISSALAQINKMSSPIRTKPNKRRKNKLTREQGNDDDEWKEVGESTASAVSTEFEEYYVVPSERTQITFNSIAVLLKIVIPMINHPHQNDSDVIMKHGPSIRRGGTTKKSAKNADKPKPKIEGNVMNMTDDSNGSSKNKKRNQSYLFFDKVYSITTERQLRSIKKEVQQIQCIINDLYCKVSYKKGKTLVHQHGKSLLFDLKDRRFVTNIFRESIMTPAEIIQRTLLTSFDSDAEKFGHRVDEAIIAPLGKDARDLHRLHAFSVQNLLRRLTQILTGAFRDSHLEIYGSCLSKLYLGKSSDVDISLYIPGAYDIYTRYQDGRMDKISYQKKMKKFVYKTFDSLNDRGNRPRGAGGVEFRNMEAVPFARVPVIRGIYQNANNPFSKDGSIHFDICILNDIAVANSGLLREYSLLDDRVKMLMLSVKSWAKWKRVGNAADNTLSSYTWMIMCIYYLQCIDFLPTLQCPSFMKHHGKEHDPLDRMQNVNGLRTSYLTSEDVLKQEIWKQPEHFKTTPISGLLAGFFLFYARLFPHETTAVSIRLGTLGLNKSVFKSSRLWRIVIEDPFETHDSHCPHDLGTPLTESGQCQVMEALKEGADKMEQMCIDCDEIENCIGSFHFVDRLQGPQEKPQTDHKQPAEGERQDQKNKSGGARGNGRSNNRNARNRARKHIAVEPNEDQTPPQKEGEERENSSINKGEEGISHGKESGGGHSAVQPKQEQAFPEGKQTTPQGQGGGNGKNDIKSKRGKKKRNAKRNTSGVKNDQAPRQQSPKPKDRHEGEPAKNSHNSGEGTTKKKSRPKRRKKPRSSMGSESKVDDAGKVDKE